MIVRRVGQPKEPGLCLRHVHIFTATEVDSVLLLTVDLVLMLWISGWIVYILSIRKYSLTPRECMTSQAVRAHLLNCLREIQHMIIPPNWKLSHTDVTSGIINQMVESRGRAKFRIVSFEPLFLGALISTSKEPMHKG